METALVILPFIRKGYPWLNTLIIPLNQMQITRRRWGVKRYWPDIWLTREASPLSAGGNFLRPPTAVWTTVSWSPQSAVVRTVWTLLTLNTTNSETNIHWADLHCNVDMEIQTWLRTKLLLLSDERAVMLSPLIQDVNSSVWRWS